MHRVALALVCFLALVVGVAPPAAAVPDRAEVTAPLGPSWAATEIEAVVAAGLMGPDAATFRPDDALTRGELHEAILALGRSHTASADPDRVVTMRELDAQLVLALGLIPSSRAIRLVATSAGLQPVTSLGTETVARLLGLRVNHPQRSESLERAPNEPASRAEAAYSLARILSLDPARLEQVRTAAASFSLPVLDALQQMVLTRALRFVGFPYVWAGTSESRQKLWSETGLVAMPGGFDCSGLVWRVYKTKPFEGASQLQAVLQGRTTFAMSGEVTTDRRLDFLSLAPGDVIFFGDRGPQSKPSQVGHSGIYVGNGWFVHSSAAGVTLQPLQGWYANRFAWARRPLAEAGLSA